MRYRVRWQHSIEDKSSGGKEFESLHRDQVSALDSLFLFLSVASRFGFSDCFGSITHSHYNRPESGMAIFPLSSLTCSSTATHSTTSVPTSVHWKSLGFKLLSLSLDGSFFPPSSAHSYTLEIILMIHVRTSGNIRIKLLLSAIRLECFHDHSLQHQRRPRAGCRSH